MLPLARVVRVPHHAARPDHRPLTRPCIADYLETTMGTTDTDIVPREALVARLQGEIKAGVPGGL